VLTRDSAEETRRMIPAALPAVVPDWTTARDHDPVVQQYRTFFALLDWEQVPERDAHRPWPGRLPHPRQAYIKALLVNVCEQQAYITHLRAFLVAHPLLVLELGFRPVPDPTQPYGFDVARTVPCCRWLRHQQQHLDHAVLHALLRGTVQALRAAIPDLGTTVAVDVKHIYAWVQENNPKQHVAQRFDPTRQPRGDPDCRLGVKRTRNQAGPTQKTYLWGYGTGIVSATRPPFGDVVLADLTQPFNQPDVTYFAPLDQQASAHLGQHPTNLAADAAFDAWSVYQPYAVGGGVAAIALNQRGPRPPRDAAGHPGCAHGWAMVPTRVFTHEDGYRAQRYRCPLLCPTPSGATCDHAQFAKGGCTKAVNIEPGGQMRLSLDRQAEPYRTIYRQRTSAERINSQATALGIERPKVRRAAAVARRNTLIYLVINVRALQRVRARTASHAPPVLC
jgi:hypothetical protein